jgi:transcriptional regulator with XRE-family HTH domain
VGRGKRIIPARMPAKLKTIRMKQTLTMDEMAKALERELESLDYKNIKVHSSHVSEYEKGKREPLLPILLAYSNIFNVELSVLVNDKKELLALPFYSRLAE